MSSGTGALKDARSALRGMIMEVTMATLQAPTTRHRQTDDHHTDGIRGLLNYLPILTRNDDWKGGNGSKRSAKIAESESQRIHYDCM